MGPLPARAIGVAAAIWQEAVEMGAAEVTWLIMVAWVETVVMESTPAINHLPSPKPRGPAARRGAPRAVDAFRDAWATAKSLQKNYYI
ncbi:hypothetical protein TNCV_4474121 [Trichonephila clavipes]|nr:hypothetical protein TNCV_4474121 [Trichonephila clavipes]